jgi:hypothetical protein
MRTLRRGAVVEHPPFFDFDPHPRPYLIASGETHPFYGEEYVVMAITTTEHPVAIPIEDGDWVRGGLPRRSYVKPWQPALLKHTTIVDAYGRLKETAVDRATRALGDIIDLTP